MFKKIMMSAVLATAMSGAAMAQGTAQPQAGAPAATAPAPAAPAAAAPAVQPPVAAAPAPAAAPADVASADDCIKSAFDVASKAEAKKLSNEDLDKLENLLTKMEGHCDANELKEAMVVHKDIKTMIDAK